MALLFRCAQLYGIFYCFLLTDIFKIFIDPGRFLVPLEHHTQSRQVSSCCTVIISIMRFVWWSFQGNSSVFRNNPHELIKHGCPMLPCFQVTFISIASPRVSIAYTYQFPLHHWTAFLKFLVKTFKIVYRSLRLARKDFSGYLRPFHFLCHLKISLCECQIKIGISRLNPSTENVNSC